jgi:transcriptional regulator with XRE-family HTH domain
MKIPHPNPSSTGRGIRLKKEIKMIDSRKTGAYISKLRKEKDWTQLDLSDRLYVTPQAVSRWETGDSFPDLSLLVEIAKIFHVSVDDLLNGEPVSGSRADAGRRTRGIVYQREQEREEDMERKATTGEVLTELAQGNTEQVARQVSEGIADLESVIDVAPLARPSTMNDVVSRLSGYAFNQEQIVALAPFIGGDLLSDIVNQSIVDAEQREEKVNIDLVSDLAPFLNRETLDGLVDRAVAGEIEADILVGLAPFLSREKLDSLVELGKDGTLDQSHLEELAPFLSREALDRLVDQIIDQEIEADYLAGLAPFLSRDTLDRLVDRIREGTFEKAHLEELAPFLSAETLERLIFTETDGQVDLELLESLAPFLSKDALDRLVGQVAEGNLDEEHIVAIAPFLSPTALQKLLQLVQEGSLSPDVIVELAPFLDKETMTALIRGVKR